ncbi:SAF domain-containing protein [Tessaracoccus sp. OS52]|uniref:SAF domain-containing protein n=1 Tax=Tessaracoccus sp. OS52 TaxID=2886691 RepID=UPI001D12A1EC|nr:SAF domain-containing protein [Tessaracoccus sp. OS52]MCC2592473.1 SAF domain-containing protein [Tessaracoccus sp. OS52]
MTNATATHPPQERALLTPVAARPQRRPLLIVASVLLVLLGAAGGALAWFSIGTAVEAVVARAAIERGQVLAADDFVVVQVNPDPQLQLLPPERIPDLLGKRAAHDVAAGGLVPGSVAVDELLPPAGETVIGLSLGPGFHPGLELLVGDEVRIVLVEPSYACAAAPVSDGAAETAAPASDCIGDALTVPGRVVSVSQDPASSQLFLGVQVKQEAAGLAASAAALGKAAVVLESRER